MSDKSPYRAHVWSQQPGAGGHKWVVGVWKPNGPVVFRPEEGRVGFDTHAEALAEGLAWAGELNAREEAEK